MRRGGLLMAVLLSASGYVHGMSWADLWSRPEQQTLAQRQQAYTEIQGQQYAAAAQHLKAFSDPVSNYNRGNALAHAGDLSGALSAYDAVLKSATADAPLRRDAQHNRDLVENQQKSRQPPEKQDQKDQKNGKDGKDGKDGNGAKGDKGAGGDNAGQQNKDSGNDKSQDDKSQSGRSPADQAKDRKNDEQPPGGQAPADAKSPAPQGQASPADARPGEAAEPPHSEEAQSLDQWLRWIPDDPAGLLRRKFMIEHMLNQQEARK